MQALALAPDGGTGTGRARHRFDRLRKRLVRTRHEPNAPPLLAPLAALACSAALGLAGPAGMEGPYPAARHDVVSFDAAGRSVVFASH